MLSGFSKSMKHFTKITYSLYTRKEHKKVFQDIPIVGFRNGKKLKDHLV